MGSHQPPLPMGFSWQEYWSGLPFPSPGDLRDLGIELGSPALQADSLPTELPGQPHGIVHRISEDKMINQLTVKNYTSQYPIIVHQICITTEHREAMF